MTKYSNYYSKYLGRYLTKEEFDEFTDDLIFGNFPTLSKGRKSNFDENGVDHNALVEWFGYKR